MQKPEPRICYRLLLDMYPPSKEPAWRLALRALFRFILVTGALFGSAGRLDWPRGWFFLALSVITLAGSVPVFRRENPNFFRARLGKATGGKPFDQVLYVILMASILGCLVVGGLDSRFGWSNIPFEWTYLGVVLYVAGYVPVGLAMATNPFIERTVRIQHELGHVPVTSGPYRVVRHPMYAGVLIGIAGWPLLLGSVWSYLPLGVLFVTLLLRTVLEERTLRRELPGYEEYTRRTRYRLLPGVW